MKIISVLIIMINTCLFEHCVAQGNTLSARYEALIKSECDFILKHQLGDGAFIMSGGKHNTKFKICPYFNNIAAIALLEVPSQRNISAVKRWMLWYMNHLNKDGSICDYYVNSLDIGAIPISTGDFDSIDSYAATFITLTKKLGEVSPEDRIWIKQYGRQLESISRGLALVIDDKDHLYDGFAKDNNNGLAVAKPKYKAKYTMDNSEVNQGMKDLIWLSKQVLPVLDSKFWKVTLKNNTNAIEKYLWDAKNERYFMYEGGEMANWEKFYADATCQLYPIWCQVIKSKSDRAKGLWETFNVHYPEWQSGKTYGKGAYPWTVILYTAAVMNDQMKARNYLEYLETYNSRGQKPSNWYNLEAAFVILAIKKLID